MDARAAFRRYLEQRQALGERELVFDHVTGADALRLAHGQAARAWPPPTRVAPPPPSPPAVPQSAAPPGAAVRPADRVAPLPPSPPEVHAPAPAPAPAPASAPGTPRAPVTRPAGLVVGGLASELFGGPLAELTSLADVARVTETCTRCPLSATATHNVPGEGSASAGLMCVGEAPGATEDATGRPFVGQAGKLLEKILAAIGLARDDVFICNVLKHRPPDNRNPRPDEVAACKPYLLRQIELIRPRVIVAFGTFAAQTLLETTQSIGKLREHVHRYYGVPLIVTYHPAALLRNPAWKRPTWDDVQYARRILDGTPA